MVVALGMVNIPGNMQVLCNDECSWKEITPEFMQEIGEMENIHRVSELTSLVRWLVDEISWERYELYLEQRIPIHFLLFCHIFLESF